MPIVSAHFRSLLLFANYNYVIGSVCVTKRVVCSEHCQLSSRFESFNERHNVKATVGSLQPPSTKHGMGAR